jgi:hypothetical protein
MLSVDAADRLHVAIDRAARAAAEPFKEARDSVSPRQRAIFDLLALRAERTVRLESYAYVNEHELA